MIMLVIRNLEEPKKTCARHAHVSALVVRGMSSRKRENGHGSMISRERDNVQISTGWKVGNVQG